MCVQVFIVITTALSRSHVQLAEINGMVAIVIWSSVSGGYLYSRLSTGNRKC